MIELASGVTVEARGGWELPWGPRLGLRDRTLMVGPYGSPMVYEDHVAGTVGSGRECCPDGDELRFERGGGDLVSVCLRMPETTTERDCSGWLAAPARSARLRLPGPCRFVLERTDQRWMSGDGDVLLCLRSAEPLGSRGERIRIAQHVDLLAADDRFAGWAVEHPERFLVSDWEHPSAEPPDRDLAVLLREYVQIMTAGNVELLRDGDPGVRRLFEDLKSKVDDAAGATARRKVLRDSIDNVLGAFSGT
ncbi:hypothetical protein [Streptoalloteichus hindustanus]|uniref:Uncharacterized protein n=1 Tax=Streptoalloteichus hindustanus TaxID=2017 RepID=A0A1M5CNJ5_STRHI|nr:hypothetical protein [Streptoalloteichus hindustanus]SHF56293.1 hypothetical protein SAMN05444320_104101 [Streptoalloteichus hindustanus]